jgi:uncharacterized Zn-binding protein involved in type VI secretion
MLSAVHRLTDTNTLPEPLIAGSSNVFTNSVAQGRVGDAYESGATVIVGSSTVFVNNSPIARIGDLVSDNSVAATGSPNVFAG